MVPKIVWKLQRWLGIGKERKLKKAQEILHNFPAVHIPGKRKEVNEGHLDRCKFAVSYCHQLDLSDEVIKDETLSFFLAGKVTTGVSLTWFVWVLSKNLPVETKIRQELHAVLQEDGRNRSHPFNSKEMMNKLVYLHAALSETMRLYPRIPSVARSPIDTEVVPTGHCVDPKTITRLNIAVMGKLRSIWGDDSLEFKPEMWISENGEITHEPFHKFLVFSFGPRICLGKDLAFTEMKVVVVTATILHDYDIHIVEGQDTRPNQALVVRMKNGL